MFKPIDFEEGVVSSLSQYHDLFLDVPIHWSEDILQVEYLIENKAYILDFGWYSEQFVVYVIVDSDWDVPLFRKQSEYICQAMADIREAIEFILEQKKD